MIDGNYFLLIVAALAIGTLFIRGFFISLSHKMNISSKVRELFTFIPAAIFPAIMVPATYFHKGQVEWVLGKERFLILLITGVVCYFKRNTLFAISFGLTLLFVIRSLS